MHGSVFEAVGTPGMSFPEADLGFLVSTEAQVARPLLLMSPLHIPAKPPRAPRADRGWARRAPKVRRGVVLQRFRCQFEQPRRDSAIRGFLRTASGNLAPARNRRTCLRVLSRRQWLLRAAVVGHSASASQSSLCVHAAAL
ncbi:unnamed protein product [Prorocentrum cordatum]|uniref:Uncharacterized protein n=1 Tax=Prorocentrum cordatum TaxID=2364126 RepID=A0ABN9WLZ2_9DINO|nr:unnamed protein product [Polarella glacialis]